MTAASIIIVGILLPVVADGVVGVTLSVVNRVLVSVSEECILCVVIVLVLMWSVTVGGVSVCVESAGGVSVGVESVGVEPVGVESVGLESVGVVSVGVESVGVVSVGVESVGVVSVGVVSVGVVSVLEGTWAVETC